MISFVIADKKGGETVASAPIKTEIKQEDIKVEIKTEDGRSSTTPTAVNQGTTTRQISVGKEEEYDSSATVRSFSSAIRIELGFQSSLI